MSTTMSNSNKIDWNDVIKKEARGLNDYNFGEVQDVKTCYIHTKKGTLSQTHYYIPRSRATSYDGNTLFFDVSENDSIEFKGLKRPSEEDCEMKYEAQVTKQADLMEKPLVFPETTQTRDLTDIVERIPLMTQRLDVNKHTVREEATITKIPYMETQTKEIPLTREVLTIERVTPTSDKMVAAVNEEGLDRKVIRVTLEHEAVDVTKTPYVREELIIHKKPVTETMHVSEEIRSEKFETSDNISSTESEMERKKRESSL